MVRYITDTKFEPNSDYIERELLKLQRLINNISKTSLTVSGSYSFTNGIAQSGTVVSLTGLALSYHTLSGSGLVARTGTTTVLAREITGAPGRITVSNGNGISGNPYIDLTDLGVSGTYTRVIVDNYGRITSGTTPTTLAGYSITNAYTKTEADATFAQKNHTHEELMAIAFLFGGD